MESKDIQNALLNYTMARDSFSKQTSYSELLQTISMLTMSNSDLSLIYYYDEERQDVIYSTLPVSRQNDDLPILYESGNFCFRGPTRSQSNYVSSPVLMLDRSEVLADTLSVTLSLETGYYSLDVPLKAAERKSAYLAFTGSDGALIFSTFPQAADAADIIRRLNAGTSVNYKEFRKDISQGWAVHVIVPDSVYVRDYRLALRDFIISTVIAAIIIFFLAIYFWKSIDRPIHQFDQQLNLLLADEPPAVPMHSSIAEYDHLFTKIGQLQQQIQDTIEQVIEQEQINAKVQLEKLRAQINPHFLMNTLNTLHWMALMNKQPEIDRITQSLSHLLSYNLDKESYYTNLDKELSALREYVILQKVRYDFQFDIQAPEATPQNYPCPKFILQPLVENSLKHGYRDGMDITVKVCVEQNVEITVADTGTGMDAETLQKLQAAAASAGHSANHAAADSSHSANHAAANAAHGTDRVGADSGHDANQAGADSGHDASYVVGGIGLQYVVQSLDSFYRGNYTYRITSIPGQGTRIFITFPKVKGDGYHG